MSKLYLWNESCIYHFILDFSITTLEFGFQIFLFPPFSSPWAQQLSFSSVTRNTTALSQFPIPCTETFPNVVLFRNPLYPHILLLFREKKKYPFGVYVVPNRRTFWRHVPGNCFKCKHLCGRKMKNCVRLVQISKYQSREATGTLGLLFF